MLAQAVAIGFAIPAPLIVPRAFRNRRLGPGGLFALSAGLGAMVLMPAAVMERFSRRAAANADRFETGACLGVALSLFGLWYLLEHSSPAMPTAACSVVRPPGPSAMDFYSRWSGRRWVCGGCLTFIMESCDRAMHGTI